MRRQVAWSAVWGSTLALASLPAQSLNCKRLDAGEKLSEAAEMNLKGTVDTLFVIGAVKGMRSEEVTKNVESLYAASPRVERPALRSRVLYMFCTTLEGARELEERTRVAQLQQLTETMLALDPREAPKADSTIVPSENDARRITGDWEGVYDGHVDAAGQRILLGSQGQIVIEAIDGRQAPYKPKPTLAYSDIRLDGSDLGHNVHWPSGEIERVRLQIIYRDLMIGTSSSKRRGTASYELRRRETADRQVLTSGSGTPHATDSNTR